MQSLWRTFWIVAVLLIVLPFVLFFLFVGLQLDLSAPADQMTDFRGLSNNANDWATFGSYIGGTVGPIAALLAFGAALLSIRQQQQQNREQQQQNKLNELLKLINAEVNSIQQLLMSSTSHSVPVAPPSTLTDDSLSINLNHFGYFLIHDGSRLHSDFESFITKEKFKLFQLREGFINLCRLMDIYESNGGDREIVNITKINLCIDFLFLHKVLDKTDKITERQFRPAELEKRFDDLHKDGAEDIYRAIYR